MWDERISRSCQNFKRRTLREKYVVQWARHFAVSYVNFVPRVITPPRESRRRERGPWERGRLYDMFWVLQRLPFEWKNRPCCQGLFPSLGTRLWKNLQNRRIGHFRVSLCLCFEASLSAKPFLWKWLWFTWKLNCVQNSFSYERFCT